MYGGDLARVVKYFIDNDLVGGYNVAPDWSYSIDEMAKIARIACNKKDIEIRYDSTKPDGQYRKDVDSSKLLKLLKDFDFTSLEDGIRKTYNEIKNKDILFRVNK